MKTAMKNRLAKAALLILAALLLTNLSYAGTPDNDKMKSKTAITNLIAGINSDNEGLKRSSIYYAGFYKINETLPSLIKLLKKESNPSTRILISLALKEINNSDGYEAIKNTAAKESNLKAKRMMNAIYDEYLNSLSDNLATR